MSMNAARKYTEYSLIQLLTSNRKAPGDPRPLMLALADKRNLGMLDPDCSDFIYAFLADHPKSIEDSWFIECRKQCDEWLLKWSPAGQGADEDRSDDAINEAFRRRQKEYSSDPEGASEGSKLFWHLNLLRQGLNVTAHHSEGWKGLTALEVESYANELAHLFCKVAQLATGQAPPSELQYLELTSVPVEQGRFLVLKDSGSQPSKIRLLELWDEKRKHVRYILVAGENPVEGFPGALEPNTILYLEGIKPPRISGAPQSIDRDSLVVLHPDILMDATALASTFWSDWRNGGRKCGPNPSIPSFDHMKPRGETKMATLMGQMVNNLLDLHLAAEPVMNAALAQQTESLFKKVFREDLMRVLGLPNISIKDFPEKFKEMKNGFPSKDYRGDPITEPGVVTLFNKLLPLLNAYRQHRAYCETPMLSHELGLQGRTDLLFMKDQERVLVELKTGNVFSGGGNTHVEENHKVQVQVYELIYHYCLGSPINRSYLWYPRATDSWQRRVEEGKNRIRELIKVRNLFVMQELALCHEENALKWLGSIEPQANVSNFYPAFLKDFKNAWSSLPPFHRHYASSNLAFVQREAMVSRIGMFGKGRATAYADIWRRTLAEKQELMGILCDLEIEKVDSGTNGVIVWLSSENGSQQARFREEELLVLYPYVSNTRVGSAPSSFVKCTLGGFLAKDDFEKECPPKPVMPAKTTKKPTQDFQVDLLEKIYLKVEIRQRSPEMDSWLMDPKLRFALEADYMSHQHEMQLHGIGHFVLNMPSKFRGILLGESAPGAVPGIEALEADIDLPGIVNLPFDQQRDLLDLQKEKIAELAAAAPDLFLIQGPPGCGKTSRLIPSIVRRLVNANSKTLLVANTKQAVHEICKALSELRKTWKDPANFDFIQIGGVSNDTDAVWAPDHSWNKLIELPAETLSSKALAERFLAAPVVVSTISSANESLLAAKNFDCLLVDEASQIHETSLLWLFSKIHKWILIGDPMQLPPVIQQDLSQQATAKEFKDIHFSEGSPTSVMARLFKLARHKHLEKSWPRVFAMVRGQYRMHRDIQDFPNRNYYVQSPLVAGREDQLSTEFSLYPKALESSGWLRHLASHRVVLVDVQPDRSDAQKASELDAILLLLEKMVHCTILDGATDHKASIGVCIPFRMQVNELEKRLRRRGILESLRNDHDLKIDTVERFQGGQRDIVILSTSISSTEDIERISSKLAADPLTKDPEVDCKLNVAWTRAKAQFVLVGNLTVLEKGSPGHYGNAIAGVRSNAPDAVLSYMKDMRQVITTAEEVEPIF